MKLIDLLKNVDKSGESWNRNTIDPDDMYRAFRLGDIPDWTKLNAGLSAYWIKVWMCTDSHVGVCAIYLHGELVGMSSQSGRKSSVDYSWISPEAAQKVKNFALSCCEISEELGTILTEDELNEDEGELTSVSYACQLLDKIEGYVDGKVCSVIGVNEGANTVSVKFSDGTMRESVPIRKYKFPYRVVKGGSL